MMIRGHQIEGGSQLLTARQVGELMSVSTRTIWRMLSREQLPEPIRIGSRLTRWRLADIETFLAGVEGGAA